MTWLLDQVHSFRKHKFVKDFCCRLYLACVAGDGIQEGKARMGGAASSKKAELKTRVQKSIPYLWPKWRQND